MSKQYKINRGEGPIIATAIHDGHHVRKELHDFIKLSEKERLREEDPYTGSWTAIVPTRVVAGNSRFELDVNRPRNKAIYLKPEDAWGLQVWEKELPPKEVTASLQNYDDFYAAIKEMLDEKVKEYGYFILYDLHTYNHMREGPGQALADPRENPEVNIGTKYMNREKWAPVVETFMHHLHSFDYDGRHLDVRENVKFKGGYFAQWIYETYGDQSCVMAIEFKKFFMNEWSGALDEKQHALIRKALHLTLPEVMEAAKKVII